jgi:F-type H+-transporting ATPase subunit b
MHFDATLVAAIAFFVFIGIMLYMKIPASVGAGLDAQSQAIAKELEEAKKLRLQAEELRASYEKQQSEAKAQAEEMIKQAAEDAKTLKAQAKKQLDADIAAKTQAASERIARAEQAAIDEVRAFAANAAVEIAEKMLIEDASKKGGAELLSSSIKNISKKLSELN